MPHGSRVIQIHTSAPAKPLWGVPCNGCGVCCLSEPCPLGMLLSGKRTGACRVLRWDDAMSQYRCGAVAVPILGQLAKRWISAGSGCDCMLEAHD